MMYYYVSKKVKIYVRTMKTLNEKCNTFFTNFIT